MSYLRVGFTFGLVVLVGAGCGDPYWGYGVRVKSPVGQVVSDVPVTMECPRLNVQPAKTNAQGVAHLGGMGSIHPPACTVKVTKEGYATQTFTVAETCGGDPKQCPRGHVQDVVLQPESAPTPAPAP